jgi:hypothetical protein
MQTLRRVSRGLADYTIGAAIVMVHLVLAARREQAVLSPKSH